MLVMSATPIPRTLAIILYGDLDISVIDELPANRLPIKNCVVGTGYRENAYTFIAKEVAAGPPGLRDLSHGGGERDDRGARTSSTTRRRFAGIFPPSICVEYLHGQDEAEGEERASWSVLRPGKSRCWCPPQ